MKLASFRYGPPWSKLTFQLHDDRIEMSGKDGAGSYVNDEVDLENLSGKKITIYAKDDLQKALLGLPGLLIFIGSIYFWDRMATRSTLLFYSVIGGSITMMLLGFVFAKRRKIYGWKNQHGEVILTLSDQGNSAQELDAFALKVDEAIKAQPGTPENTG